MYGWKICFKLEFIFEQIKVFSLGLTTEWFMLYKHLSIYKLYPFSLRCHMQTVGSLKFVVVENLKLTSLWQMSLMKQYDIIRTTLYYCDITILLINLKEAFLKGYPTSLDSNFLTVLRYFVFHWRSYIIAKVCEFQDIHTFLITLLLCHDMLYCILIMMCNFASICESDGYSHHSDN